MAPLRTGYIAKGKVSLELRNFVLNAPDLVASVDVERTHRREPRACASPHGGFDPLPRHGLVDDPGEVALDSRMTRHRAEPRLEHRAYRRGVSR